MKSMTEHAGRDVPVNLTLFASDNQMPAAFFMSAVVENVTLYPIGSRISRISSTERCGIDFLTCVTERLAYSSSVSRVILPSRRALNLAESRLM